MSGVLAVLFARACLAAVGLYLHLNLALVRQILTGLVRDHQKSLARFSLLATNGPGQADVVRGFEPCGIERNLHRMASSIRSTIACLSDRSDLIVGESVGLPLWRRCTCVAGMAWFAAAAGEEQVESAALSALADVNRLAWRALLEVHRGERPRDGRADGLVPMNLTACRQELVAAATTARSRLHRMRLNPVPIGERR